MVEHHAPSQLFNSVTVAAEHPVMCNNAAATVAWLRNRFFCKCSAKPVSEVGVWTPSCCAGSGGSCESPSSSQQVPSGLQDMADPWQSAYDYAVEVARTAGEVGKVGFQGWKWVQVCILFPSGLVQVVRIAGESEIKVQTKSSAVDLVTKTDERVEKIIIGSLKKKFGEGAHW